jgi:uncharacterized membrane protein
MTPTTTMIITAIIVYGLFLRMVWIQKKIQTGHVVRFRQVTYIIVVLVATLVTAMFMLK